MEKNILGRRAYKIGPDGHCHIIIDGVDYLAEELAVYYMTGRWPKYGVEHINFDTQDNRLENLREKTVGSVVD